MKTPTQEKLEAQRGQDIKQIVTEALETHRGKFAALRASMELEISDATLYSWCREYGIAVEDYTIGAEGE